MEIDYIYNGFRIIALLAYLYFMWNVLKDDEFLNRSFRTRGFVKIFGKKAAKITLVTFYSIVALTVAYTFFL